jgi:hypothetical protein
LFLLESWYIDLPQRLAMTHSSTMKYLSLFQDMCGSWEGECRTWFEPGVLADTSPIKGTISHVINDQFIRHVYTGSINDTVRRGEETLILNELGEQVEVAWIDSFHMNYGILFSKGAQVGPAVSVFGLYDVEPGTPRWGWRTAYRMPSKDTLIITAFNVSPQGDESKAVEVHYKRT